MRHGYQQYIFYITINSLWHNRFSRRTAHPRNRATPSVTSLQYIRLSRRTAQPRNSHRASVAPRIACTGLGKPPTRLSYSLPCSMAKRYGFSVTPKGRVSPVRRKGITLLPRIVRRLQHLPPERQLRSTERSTHFLLSSLRYAGLFRTRQASLPDSTAQLSVLPDRPTILPTIHHRPLVRLLIRNLHTPTQRNHTINSIYIGLLE